MQLTATTRMALLSFLQKYGRTLLLPTADDVLHHKHCSMSMLVYADMCPQLSLACRHAVKHIMWRHGVYNEVSDQGLWTGFGLQKAEQAEPLPSVLLQRFC